MTTFGKPQPAFAEQQRRMTDAQRDKLWDLCGRYNVPFREDDYYKALFSNGMYEGWIGGNLHSGTNGFKKTIYIGVEPNGDSHS